MSDIDPRAIIFIIMFSCAFIIFLLPFYALFKYRRLLAEWVDERIPGARKPGVELGDDVDATELPISTDVEAVFNATFDGVPRWAAVPSVLVSSIGIPMAGYLLWQNTEHVPPYFAWSWPWHFTLVGIIAIHVRLLYRTLCVFGKPSSPTNISNLVHSSQELGVVLAILPPLTHVLRLDWYLLYPYFGRSMWMILLATVGQSILGAVVFGLGTWLRRKWLVDEEEKEDFILSREDDQA